MKTALFPKQGALKVRYTNLLKDMPRNRTAHLTTDDMGNEIEISNEVSDSQWRKSAQGVIWVDRLRGFADSGAG